MCAVGMPANRQLMNWSLNFKKTAFEMKLTAKERLPPYDFVIVKATASYHSLSTDKSLFRHQ